MGLSIAGMAALLIQPGLEPGALAAGATPAAVQARALGRMFQGTPDGQVFESLDNGQSWNRIAKFGQHCQIDAIREARSQVHVDISVQGHHFSLKSADARLWLLVS